MKAFWSVTGSILFAATIAWGGFNVASLLGHEELRDEYTYAAADVRSIDVSNDAGDITIIDTGGGDGDGEIHVTAEISSGIQATRVSHELVDGVLFIRASCPEFGSPWCDANLTIEAPRDTVIVANSADGDVTVRSDDLGG